MSKSKIIIIGSGIGGMAVAIRLAVKGFDVEVFEKNNYPGGKLSAFEKDGFHFDAGPSLFTQPQNIEELFLLADEKIDDYFSYEPVNVSCKYFYENGKIISAFKSIDDFEKELTQQLNERPGSLKKYLSDSKKLYKNIAGIFLNHSLHKRKTWFSTRIIKALATIKYPYLFQSLHQYNSKKFKSGEAIQLFDRYATYNGSNPYKAPGMLSLIPHLEQNEGVFYPKGGMINITNAVYKLALDKGVKFHFNSLAERITTKGNYVTGIKTKEREINADTIVSNGDIYFTYKELLNREDESKKILKQERSSSAVIFYWGIKKQFKQLGLHNIFFSNNYQAEFENIFTTKKIITDPTIYINITSKMEKTLAPVGKENWFVMVNAPANTGQDWAQLKQQLRTNIISKLTRLLKEDIATLIETEHVLDPIGIEQQTSSYMGSLYGSSSNSKLAAFLRHPNFSSSINGLYFCGGSVHPGGGIPLCLKSAKIVSDLITDDLRK